MTDTANLQGARLGVAVTLAITAAVCGPAASAAADPTPGSVCDPNLTTNPSYDPKFCSSWTQAPTPTTGRVEQGLGRLMDNPFVVAGGILVAVLVIGWILATVFGTGDVEEKGRRIAGAHTSPARQAAPAADPATYDPLGLGLAAPSAPATPGAAPIPEPQLTDEDARRYARYGYAVDYEMGSAFASLTSRSGDWKKAEAAWNAACQAAALGETEMRKRLPGVGRIPGVDAHREVYVAPADLVRVIPLENGDATVVVKPRSVAIGADELDRAVPMFLRTARLRHAGRFAREHTTDEYLLTVTNRDSAVDQPVDAAVSFDDEWS